MSAWSESTVTTSGQSCNSMKLNTRIVQTLTKEANYRKYWQSTPTIENTNKDVYCSSTKAKLL